MRNPVGKLFALMLFLLLLSSQKQIPHSVKKTFLDLFIFRFFLLPIILKTMIVFAIGVCVFFLINNQ